MTPPLRGTPVSATYCSHCGAALPAGSQFCSYCGSAVPAVGSAGAPASPLPSAGPTPPPYPPYPSMEPSRPPASRRRRGLVIAVIVVVLIAVIGVILVSELNAGNVQVNSFVFYAPDDVCGYNNATAVDNQGFGPLPIEYQGFSDSPGVTDSFQFTIQNFNITSSCNVVSVATNTSGFSLSDAGYPGVIPGGGTDTGTLSVDLTLPGSSWTGNVNIIIG